MSKAPSGAALEEQLMTTLSRSGMDREHLKELVQLVGSLHASGVRPVKVFPYGIPNPDGVEVHSILQPDALNALLGVLKNPRIDTLRVFPKGIPVPDVYLTEIRMR